MNVRCAIAILALLAKPLAAAAPSIADDVWSHGTYTIKVLVGSESRAWGSILEHSQVLPAPQDVLADLPSRGTRCDGLGLDTVPAKRRWWGDCSDGFPIPVTVNVDVVRYYQSAIRDLAKKGQNSERRPTSASLEHEPRVSHSSKSKVGAKAYTDVTLVRLPIHITFGGGGCSTDIRMERILVYDAKEQLLAILGDGIITPKTICI